jgi:hypothetical protein
MILLICFPVADSKAKVFAPCALPRQPYLGPPLDITDRDRALQERRELGAKLGRRNKKSAGGSRWISTTTVQLLAGLAIGPRRFRCSSA